jgi:hypothetical protein
MIYTAAIIIAFFWPVSVLIYRCNAARDASREELLCSRLTCDALRQELADAQFMYDISNENVYDLNVENNVLSAENNVLSAKNTECHWRICAASVTIYDLHMKINRLHEQINDHGFVVVY